MKRAIAVKIVLCSVFKGTYGLGTVGNIFPNGLSTFKRFIL